MQAQKPTLAAAILAHDEAAHLEALLATLAFVDEVVVADAASTDGTAQAARRAGARVLAVANDLNLNVNKAKAIAACAADWVLYLDPDERVPAELGAEIKAAVADAGAPWAAYEFPRLNNYFGRYLRRGGLYPDYQLRLFKRGTARFPCRSVHERLAVDGPVGRLRHPLLHETYPALDDYLRKMRLFVAAGADALERRGAPAGPGADLYFLWFRPQLRFFSRYILKAGFLDGRAGVMAAFLDAVQAALTYFAYRSRPRRAAP